LNEQQVELTKTNRHRGKEQGVKLAAANRHTSKMVKKD
jgi:hypothetical protein